VSDKLEFTGERFTPECEREIRYEHYHRYAFASRLSRGARVLDAACGEGYGAALLASVAGSVVGVDISATTIRHAEARYGHLSGLEFEVADCTRLPFADGSFDRVVSFETLEHLEAQDALLAEFRRVLDPGGFVVLSSPDKAVYSDQQGFENAFHVRELYREELEALVAKHFPAYHVLGQKLLFHSAIWPQGDSAKACLQTLDDDGRLESGTIRHAPMYFIVICGARADCLPDLSGQLWLFDDAAESVYRHYHHEIRKNMAAGGVLAEREQELERLQKELERSRKPWWRRLLGG
jgi:SAM-dependent methyltransferase